MPLKVIEISRTVEVLEFVVGPDVTYSKLIFMKILTDGVIDKESEEKISEYYIGKRKYDSEIDTKKTEDELEKLINDKSIVLVSRNDELKNKSLPVDNEEEVKEFDFINIGMRNCYEQLNNYVHEKSHYINDIIPILREEFDNKKLILDVKKYLNKLTYEINDFIFWRKMPCTFDANEDPYNIWYENSNERNMILGLSNILNNK